MQQHGLYATIDCPNGAEDVVCFRSRTQRYKRVMTLGIEGKLKVGRGRVAKTLLPHRADVQCHSASTSRRSSYPNLQLTRIHNVAYRICASADSRAVWMLVFLQCRPHSSADVPTTPGSSQLSAPLVITAYQAALGTSRAYGVICRILYDSYS